jgi:hypothetical protein
MCCVCCSAQNVPDLGRLGERVEVRGGGSIGGGTCSCLSGFSARVFRSPVRIQCGDALKLRPPSTVSKRPRRFDGSTRSSIVATIFLEDGKYLLSALHGSERPLAAPPYSAQSRRGRSSRADHRRAAARGNCLEHRSVCGPSISAEFRAARGATTTDTGVSGGGATKRCDGNRRKDDGSKLIGALGGIRLGRRRRAVISTNAGASVRSGCSIIGVTGSSSVKQSGDEPAACRSSGRPAPIASATERIARGHALLLRVALLRCLPLFRAACTARLALTRRAVERRARRDALLLRVALHRRLALL